MPFSTNAKGIPGQPGNTAGGLGGGGGGGGEGGGGGGEGGGESVIPVPVSWPAIRNDQCHENKNNGTGQIRRL